MPVSLERYLFVNWAMSFTVAALCARSKGRVAWGPVWFASAFGAGYAVAMYWPPLRLLRAWPVRLLMMGMLSAIALQAEGWKQAVCAGGLIGACTLFMAGVMQLLCGMLGLAPMPGALLTIPVGGGALLMLLSWRARRLEVSEVYLQVRTRFGRARFTALIDTGNRLHEPVSGLPVLIVEQRLLADALPPGFCAETALKRLPRGFRLVRYGALGGEGTMPCFQPEGLLASYGDGWMRAPDVWVAIYPGRMAGSVHALAPAVIGHIETVSGAGNRRIISHGVSWRGEQK